MVQYLIRLDDLCHTSNLDKWVRFFNLFDQYNIKPIIAAIPNNKDPKLAECGSFNHNYWQLVRDLQKKGYVIAMHGLEHRYLNTDSGIFKQNRRSEFAGLPLYIQERKIIEAVSIFERESIKTDIFVAPAHSIDRNTLKALKKYSKISIISDGLLTSPYRRFGFKWIPVQLSEVAIMPDKTWTFNYHPEMCPDEAFTRLEAFIHQHHENFVPLSDLKFQSYSRWDNFYEKYCIYLRLIRSGIKGQLSL